MGMIATLLLASCGKNANVLPEHQSNEYQEAQAFVESYIPVEIPVEIAFLIEREFVHRYNDDLIDTTDLVQSYRNFLELRLLELYPTVTYPGFIDDAVEFNESVETMVEYDESLTYETDTFETQLTNIGLSFDSLMAQQNLNAYDELASSVTYFEKIDSLAKYGVTNSVPVELYSLKDIAHEYAPAHYFGAGKEDGWFLIAVGVGTAVYVIWKVAQTVHSNTVSHKALLREKAHNEARLNFGLSGTYPNSVGMIDNDVLAAKQITEAVYLRIAYGKVHTACNLKKEVKRNNGSCESSNMQWHNNRVGYAKKYNVFRDKGTLTKQQKEEMADNVYDWVVDVNTVGQLENGIQKSWFPTYGNYFWQDTGCDNCKDDRKNTNKKKYIYIN